MVLAGTAGVGKTRVAREVVRAQQARGATAGWVQGSQSARAVPLGAFAPMLPSATSGATSLASAVARLASDAARHRLVVGVDDAHLLDDLSAMLVQQLASVPQAMLVVTLRYGEAAPDAITSLWKDDLLDRIEIPPLDRGETVQVLEAALDGLVDRGSVDRMLTLTGGNALFLRHLVDGEQAAGRFRLSAGVWAWSGGLSLSPVLTQLLADQIGDLDATSMAVLDLLAVGEPLGVDVLTCLHAASSLERVERLGLMAVERAGRRVEARLAHPLYGEQRRSALGSMGVRRVAAELSAALSHVDRRRSEDLLRRAVLADESAAMLDAGLLTAGAARALAVGDAHLACRLARRAVGAGAGYSAQLVVVTALAGMADEESIKKELATLDELAPDDVALVQVTLLRVLHLGWVAADPVAACDLLDRVDAGLSSPALHRELMAVRSYLLAQLGRTDEALRDAREALSDPALPPGSAALAHGGLVTSLALVGSTHELEAAVAGGYACAERSGAFAYLRVPLALMHLMGLRLSGRLLTATSVADSIFASVRGTDAGAALGCLVMGEAALATGQVRTAVRWLREAKAGFVPEGNVGGMAYVGAVALTQALAACGETGQAVDELEVMRAIEHPTLRCLAPDALLAEAWVAAARGSLTEAVVLARKAADTAASRGAHAFEVLALHTTVRFGDGSPGRRLEGLRTQVTGPRVVLAAAHADALAAADGQRLVAVARQLRACGDLLAAADAAAQAHSVLARRGDRAAASAAALARELMVACEDARTPSLVRLPTAFPLSRREAEVVSLALGGASNAEIAEELHLSVRTVEGHVYRAGIKLGAPPRSAARAAGPVRRQVVGGREAGTPYA